MSRNREDIALGILADCQQMGLTFEVVGGGDKPPGFLLHFPEEVADEWRREIRALVGDYREDILALLQRGAPGARMGRSRTGDGRPGQESG